MVLRIEHCLLAPKKATLETVSKVISHPQGLEKSGRFLKRHNWQLNICENTAVAARDVSLWNDISYAAVASKRAGEIYGLQILASKINDFPDNYTRFVVLSTSDIVIPQADKISLVFTVRHEPGALYAAIRGFAEQNVNLMKLESRPIWTEAWHYFFHMDCAGNVESPKIQKALRVLERHCTTYRILGNYKAFEEEQG